MCFTAKIKIAVKVAGKLEYLLGEQNTPSRFIPVGNFTTFSFHFFVLKSFK